MINRKCDSTHHASTHHESEASETIPLGECTHFEHQTKEDRPMAPLSYSEMVRPERFELPTYWFVASRSIQLS
jgi:hypothetical protein